MNATKQLELLEEKSKIERLKKLSMESFKVMTEVNNGSSVHLEICSVYKDDVYSIGTNKDLARRLRKECIKYLEELEKDIEKRIKVKL